MIFRLTILWGRGEGLCPGITSKSTLSRWMMVIEDPYFGDMVRLVALKRCWWTEELLSIFPRLFDGALVGVDICIGGS